MQSFVPNVLVVALILAGSVFMAGVASTFALSRADFDRLDARLESRISADYSRDDRLMKFAPLDGDVIEAVKQDEERSVEASTTDGVEIVQPFRVDLPDSVPPTASPTPSPRTSPRVTPSPTATPSPSAAPTPVLTAAPTLLPTVAPTPIPTATPKPPTPAPTGLPTVKPTATPVPTPQPTAPPTSTPTVAPTATPTVAPTLEVAPSPTAMLTPTPTPTPTPKPTPVVTLPPGVTPAPTPKLTPTLIPTPTLVPTPIVTLPPGVTPSPTPILTPTPTPTPTPSPAATPPPTPTPTPTPTPAPPVTVLAHTIAAGAKHSCVLNAAGNVYCWGENDKGQLGNGTTSDSQVAVLVSGLSGARSVAAGEKHTCAVLVSGQVKCWGQNNEGQLGDGTTTNRPTPATVVGVSNAGAVAGGKEHTCAALLTGQIKCWGRNDKGQLGNGSGTDSLAAVNVTGLSGAYSIAAGEKHTCATLTSGAASCWGHNNKGQLGNGTTSDSTAPVSVASLTGAVEVTAGKEFSCAIVLAGSMKCWGNNDRGQLGNGTRNDSLTPVSVSGLPGSTKHSAAGAKHTCSLAGDASGRCWGENDKGQLGNGTTTDSNNPVVVSGLVDGADIATGEKHSCAIRTNRVVVCWGRNDKGQLGDGTTNDKPVPAAVIFPDGSPPMDIPTGTTVTVSVPQSGDAMVMSNNPGQNFGTHAHLEVRSVAGGGNTDRSFLMFDLSDTPPGSPIQNATLTLCLTSPPTQPGGTHQVRRVASGWLESSITWNNQPPVSAAVTDSKTVPSTAGCLSYNVTADVQSWVSGATNYGWRVSEQFETAINSSATYASRDHLSAALKPTLIVTYEGQPPLTLHLHNKPTPPSGNTSSQPLLSMDLVAPTAGTLYNYDVDRDSSAGIVIKKGGSGAAESDPAKYQSWMSPKAATAIPIENKVTLTMFTAMKGFANLKSGSVTVYLRDFDGTTSTTIATAGLTRGNWQNGAPTWTSFTIDLLTGPYTLQAGHALEAKIIVNGSSFDDLWFAYDTSAYASRVLVPIAP